MTQECLRQLRERTHLSLTECKKALDKANGDIEQAIIILQQSGSIKKVDSLIVPTEGLVRAYAGLRSGRILEIRCQTDFASRSPIFQGLVKDLAELPPNPEAEEKSISLVARQLGEVILKEKDLFLESKTEKTILSSYTHHSGKIAVLLEAECDIANAQIHNSLNEICMQIAANNPMGLDRSSLKDKEEAQKLIFEAQVPAKAAAMKEKIISGKLDKWYQENTLLEQESLFHPGQTVQALLTQNIPPINLVGYARFQMG